MGDTSPIRDATFWREEFLGFCELAEELRRNGQVDPDDDSEDPGDPQEEVIAADLEPGKPSSSALKKVSAVVPIHALRTTTCTIVQFLKEAVIRLHRIPTYECACCERIFHSSSRLVNHLEIYHADAIEVESDIDNSITITAIPDVEIVEKTSAIIKLIPEESVNTSVTTVVQGATDSNTQGIVTTDEEMITNISSPASLIPYRYSPTCLESETLSSPAVAEDINDLPILPCTGTGNCQLSSTTNPTDLIVQTSKEPVVENMSVLVLPKPVVPEIPVSEDLQQWTPKEPECLEQRIQDSHNGNIPPLILPQQAATHSPTLMLSSLHVHHSPTTLVQISPSQAEHNQALLLPIQPVQHLPELLLTSPPVSNFQPLLLLPALPVHEEPICTVTTSHSNLNPAHSVEQTPKLPDEIPIAINHANDSTSHSNTSDFSDLIVLPNPNQPLHEALPLSVVQQRSEERYKFACSWCKSVFKSLNQLKSHRNSSHSLELERNRVQKFEVKEHKCGLCDEVFKTASAMLQHISVHTPALSANIYIQCMLCQKLFLTPQGLDQHQRKIHPNQTADQTTGGASAPHIVLDAGQQSDKPGTPDIMSSAASNLNNILSNYPAEVARSFYTIGARVEDSMITDNNLNNTLNNAESPSDPVPDPDPPCFNIDGAKTEEPPRKKRRQCLLCPDVFLSRVDLCEHLEQSHFIDAIPVECKICKSKFDSCTVFKRHVITHKDKTSECSSSAARKNYESGLTKQSHPSELERLLILSPTPTTELELKCDHCPAVYSDLFSMKIHCKLYHSNMNTDSTAAATSMEASSTSNPEQEILRPNQPEQQLLTPHFEVPSLQIQTQSSILNNLLSSPVSKPDPCEICGLEFQFRHQLVEHVYQLHRETRVCCGIIFTSQSGLSIHQSRLALGSLSTTEISSTAAGNTGGVLLQQQVLAAEGVRHLPALIKILPKSSKSADTPSPEIPNPSPSTTGSVDQQALVAVSPAVLEAYVQASLVKKKGKQGNQQNRNHKCLLCNKYFTRTGLVSHLGRIHFQAERRDKFECTTGACKLRFSTSQELVQHEQSHVEQNTTETVKVYPCSCCPIIFKQQWQKKAHENIYHKKKTASVVSSNSKPAHGNETIINIELVGGSSTVQGAQEHGEQLQQGLNSVSGTEHPSVNQIQMVRNDPKPIQMQENLSFESHLEKLILSTLSETS